MSLENRITPFQPEKPSGKYHVPCRGLPGVVKKHYYRSASNVQQSPAWCSSCYWTYIGIIVSEKSKGA